MLKIHVALHGCVHVVFLLLLPSMQAMSLEDKVLSAAGAGDWHQLRSLDTVRLSFGRGGNCVTSYKQTPMHMLAVHKDPRAQYAIRMLAVLHHPINTKDAFDETPLHRAARAHNDDAIKILLSLGAGRSLRIKNTSGQTPRDIFPSYPAWPAIESLHDSDYCDLKDLAEFMGSMFHVPA